jgi:serine/threonine protein kinase
VKEVEAKTLDKLNEYKEEAVQLFKVQNHPNIVQFYGYYFYETMYNTFRIALVCEYMEARNNLEYMFRKRKQQNVFWKQDELEKMIVSGISTLSYLQNLGICHRDMKPANMFVPEWGDQDHRLRREQGLLPGPGRRRSRDDGHDPRHSPVPESPPLESPRRRRRQLPTCPAQHLQVRRLLLRVDLLLASKHG